MSSPAGQRVPIWVVEDNALYRQTITNVLDRSERLCCAHAFAEGESALSALADPRNRTERPRLILMDIALPGLSGTECVQRIRAHNDTIPVVMLTVYESNERIFEAICAGASGYLLKSASRDEIIAGIENVLRGGAAMDALIARRVLDMFGNLVAPRADYGLSDREKQILQMLVGGMKKNDIATELVLSPHTIDSHVRRIYGKLHVNNRSGAVAKAVKENLT